jgi:hypothetical protein
MPAIQAREISGGPAGDEAAIDACLEIASLLMIARWMFPRAEPWLGHFPEIQQDLDAGIWDSIRRLLRCM